MEFLGTKWQKQECFTQNAVVACQGTQGAYSQIAAKALFGNPTVLYMRTFDGVFRAVDRGLCRYGVLPLENSTAGSVTDVYDLMKEYHFYIIKGVKLTVSHVLLAKDFLPIEKIKEVYTHEQAAKQCSRFLEQHQNMNINLSPNTAKAAEFVALSSESGVAAIASSDCADIYGLKQVAKDVQNHASNFTRFICISKEPIVFRGADKISLVLNLEHKPGSLFDAIKCFADAGLNLTKLESRPIPNSDFEFSFYFDVSANLEDAHVQKTLSALNDSVSQLTVLGNYGEIVC